MYTSKKKRLKIFFAYFDYFVMLKINRSDTDNENCVQTYELYVPVHSRYL